MISTSHLAALLALPSIFFACNVMADSNYHGIELTVNALPGERRSETVLPQSSTGYGEDSATELTLMYRFQTRQQSAVAFILGVGLDVIAVDYGPTSETLYGFRIEPGVAMRVSDKFRVEGMVAFAIGSSSAIWGQELALVRPVYRFDSGLSVHAQFGYTYMGTLFSDVDEGDEISGTSRKGTFFGAGLAYRFR